MDANQDNSGRYVFLDYLRVGAAWLVVWDHFGTIMPGWAGRVFAPAQWVRDNITGPLAIIQDFGWFGVALFFLISGFIISDRARVETARQFLVRRILRVYPMLAVAVVLAAFLLAPKDKVNAANILLNISLANYLIAPQVVLLGVAWTLAIEAIFYGLTAATQFARESPHRIALNLAFIGVVIWRCGAFGPNFALFAGAVGYLPILVMGQTLYWWLARRRLSALWGLTYLLAACGVFVRGLRTLQPGFLATNNSYVVSVAFALLAFVILMQVRAPERRAVRFLSNTSYSMYLLHGIIGQLAFAALAGRPLTLIISVAAAISLGAASLTYLLIELPFQRLGRHLAGGEGRGVPDAAMASTAGAAE